MSADKTEKGKHFFQAQTNIARGDAVLNNTYPGYFMRFLLRFTLHQSGRYAQGIERNFFPATTCFEVASVKNPSQSPAGLRIVNLPTKSHEISGL